MQSKITVAIVHATVGMHGMRELYMLCIIWNTDIGHALKIIECYFQCEQRLFISSINIIYIYIYIYISMSILNNTSAIAFMIYFLLIFHY